MKPVDKYVMVIINILSSSRLSIEFMMRNIILAPSMIALTSTTFLQFPNIKLVHGFVLYLEFLSIQCMLCFTLEYYNLLCQGCCENFTTSGEFLIQVILITITILFLVTVLFLTTDKWTVMCNSKTSSNPIA